MKTYNMIMFSANKNGNARICKSMQNRGSKLKKIKFNNCSLLSLILHIHNLSTY